MLLKVFELVLELVLVLVLEQVLVLVPAGMTGRKKIIEQCKEILVSNSGA
jgi:hypothetical protein